jgi:hypothetical protein
VIGALVLLFLLSQVADSHRSLMLIVVALIGFSFVLLSSTPTISRVLLLAEAGFIGVPLIPGLHEQKRAQLAALAALAIWSSFSSGRIAAKRGIDLRMPGLAAALFVVLPLLTVGVFGLDEPRLLAGMLTAGLLFAGVTCGMAATEHERRAALIGGTAIAFVMAIAALVENHMGKPIYLTNPFQAQPTPGSQFRASAFMGHPLVLAGFLAAFLIANLARPANRYPLFMRSRAVVSALLIAGIAASVTRSAIPAVAGGILALLVSRRPSDGASRRKAAFGIAAVLALIVYLVLNSGTSQYADRFRELNSTEQQVRITGPQVVNSLTHGNARLIGNGPRAVAAAADQGDALAAFGTVDNQYLDAFADYGYLGSGALVLLSVVLLIGLRRRMTALTRCGVLIGVPILVAMFFYEPLSWPSVGLIFAFAVGSACRPSRAEVSEAEDSGRVERPAPIVGVGVLQDDALGVVVHKEATARVERGLR